tara:strand:+ start:16835 stop:17065 length:231 start_codon:yes stop_codon:yes gene_type:complete
MNRFEIYLTENTVEVLNVETSQVAGFHAEVVNIADENVLRAIAEDFDAWLTYPSFIADFIEKADETKKLREYCINP